LFEKLSVLSTIKKENSEGLKKAHERGDVPTEQLNGNRGWLKGKSYEEAYGKERSKKVKKKLSQRKLEWFESRTEEELKKFRKKISRSLKTVIKI